MIEPKLRFSEFKDEWKGHILNDYATEISRVNVESDAPVMMISAGNGFIYQADRYKKDNAGTSLKKYIELHREEFAYNHGYSKAKIYGSVFMLMEEQKARVPFVYHCFSIENGYKPFFAILLNRTQLNRELVKYISSTARQDGLLNISFEDFMQVKIYVPSIDEQKKIAETLSFIDNIIISIELEVALWEKTKKGVMQKIFSQEVRFRKEDDSDYSEWTNTCIIDMAETYIGLVTTMTSHYVERGVPLIRNSDIRENKFVFSNPIFLDEEFAENNKSRKHKINDIITVHTGDVGTSAIIDESLVGSIGFATIVTRLNDTSKYLPSYICWYYNSSNCKRNILNVITGDGRNNLNIRDFNLLRIPIPCVGEQKKIADCLSSIDKVIEIKKEKLATWKNIKKGLLQQMFV